MIDTAFFILSKIIGLMLLVESWLVIAFALALFCLWSGAIQTTLRILSLSLIGLLLILSPLTPFALSQLEQAHPANPNLNAGAPIYGIIILGGASHPARSTYWQQVELQSSADRITQGLRLARQFPDTVVLLSGGSGSVAETLADRKLPSEAVTTRDLLRDLGLDENRMLLEERSRNTAENATLSADLLGDDRKKRWVLVTSAFHMPRSVRSFEKAGWTDLVPYPVDFRTNPKELWHNFYPEKKIEQANLLIKELVGLIVYHLSGR